jgi:anti-sigma B factor antagonist
MGRLKISARTRDGIHTLTLSGELDVASAPMLDEALDEACATEPTEIVIDLGRVEFMDSTGLSSLLRGRTLCEQHRCAYSLTPAQRPVERVFETTGLRRALRFRPRTTNGGPAAPLQST